MRGIATRQNRQFGFSLIELSIVLSIVGIITGAIWFGITAVNQHNITTQTEQELILVKNGIIAKAHGTPFTGQSAITPSLITLGIIPSLAVVSPTSARAPWNTNNPTKSNAGFGATNQTFVVYSSGKNAQSLSTFRVSFYNPPAYVCTDLIMKATNCTAGSQGCPLDVVTQNGGVVTSPDAKQGWSTMTVAAAATLCANNGVDAGSIEFDYSL